MTAVTRRSAGTAPVSILVLWPIRAPRARCATCARTVSRATVHQGSPEIHLQIVILVSFLEKLAVLLSLTNIELNETKLFLTNIND